MSNPHPNMVGLSGRPTAVGYILEEVQHAIHCWIKGRDWEPKPLTQPIVILRKQQVCRMTGLSHVTIWSREKAGRFPRRVRLDGSPIIEVTDAAE